MSTAFKEKKKNRESEKETLMILNKWDLYWGQGLHKLIDRIENKQDEQSNEVKAKIAKAMIITHMISTTRQQAQNWKKDKDIERHDHSKMIMNIMEHSFMVCTTKESKVTLEFKCKILGWLREPGLEVPKQWPSLASWMTA